MNKIFKKLITIFTVVCSMLLANQVFAHDFQGKHVLGELYGVDQQLLNDEKLLEKTLITGIEKSGATYCDSISKKFDPQGVTILILVAESHVSIHTYPEYNTMFFDAFTCGDCDPKIIAEELIRVLKPKDSNLQVIKRGS